MKSFLNKSQKIIVSCILEKNEKILLFRKNQFFDDFLKSNFGYFDIPHFLVDFGQDPKELIKRRFSEYFNYEVSDLDFVAVKQSLAFDNSIQIFEIIYKMKCSKFANEKQGLFFFADKKELSSYIFLKRYQDIISFLEK